MGRKERKIEHIEMALEQEDNKNIFKDVQLVGSCLPGLNLTDVSLQTNLAGLNLKTPLLINAITGGNKNSYWINQSLALISSRMGLAMAVGSQKAALDDPEVKNTFTVVRDVNPDGIIFANIGADASVKMAKKAVEMIEADALQVHLNVAQELVMKEGDKKFEGYLENIKKITDSLEVPVIVKEVGQGIQRKEAKMLFQAGVQGIDIGGYGGTNFIKIEMERRKDRRFSGLLNWGLPTPESLLEVLSVDNKKDVIASGGIATSMDAYKALVLGSKGVAIAGFPLRVLMREGREALEKELSFWLEELKYFLLLSGIKNLNELSGVPAVIRGELSEYARERNIEIENIALRSPD